MMFDRINHCMPLLSYLISGQPASFGMLRYDIGIEPDHIRKVIATLSKHDCKIVFTKPDECQLIHSGLPVWQDYLEYSLKFSSIAPMLVRVYRETTSTQDVAKSLSAAPAIVIAEHQTAGRGRQDKKWESSGKTGIMLSIAWPIDRQCATHDRLSMLTGVAVAQTVERFAPDARIRLKWPNDVVIDGKKLAGILIESVSDVAVIGIGINVTDAPALPENQTTCMETISGRKHDRLHIIEHLILELTKTLQHTKPMLMLDEWRVLAALGQTQTFEQAGQRITGEVMDLDPDHGLIVRRDTGEIVTLPAATTSVVK